MSGYLEDLSQALSDAGIRRRQQARILAEFRDHLECDPQAELGVPAEVARKFADELGTARARRAAFAAFAALAVAGLLFAVAFLALQAEGLPLSRWGTSSKPLESLGLGLIAIGAQVAFVSGLLALVRAVRLRRDPILTRRDAVVTGRRAMVGLAAGFACLVGLALVATQLDGRMPPWVRPLGFSAAGVGVCFLLAAAPSVASALRVRPVRDGGAGDLFDDFGPTVPRPLRGHPWVFALLVAVGVGVLISLAGVIQDDPFDGMIRGAVDAGACLVGFAVLGPYLGLWRTAAE